MTMRSLVPVLVIVGSLALRASGQSQAFFADGRKEHRLEVADTVQLFSADFDGDGRVDLARSARQGIEYLSPRRTVWRNVGGGAWAPVPGTESFGVLAVADLDGDGDIDVVDSGGVAVNDGAAGFTFTRLSSPGFGAVLRAAVGDVDGDGDADVVGQRLMLQTGTMTFVPAAQQPAGLSSSSLPVLADVDGDGDLDLVLGQQGQTNLLLNNGSGVFTDVTASALPADNDSTSDIVVTDVDGDGSLDILLANGSAPLGLYRNQGNGTFRDARALLAAVTPAVTLSLAAGDVDGDGDVDIVLGEATGGRLLLRTGASFVVAGLLRWPTDSLPMVDVEMFDADGDGDLDVMEGLGGVGYGVADRIAFNDGRGQLVPGVAAPIATPTQVSPGATRLHGEAALGDLDGDRVPDLLLTTGSTQLLVGSGRGDFAPAIDLGIAVRGRPRLGDVDGDGDLDAIIVEADRFDVLLNPGTGRLALATTTMLPPLPGMFGSNGVAADAVIADFDGDGAADVFVATLLYTPYGLWSAPDLLYAGDGRGGFVPTAWLGPNPVTPSREAVAGDVDGDGALDIVTSGRVVYLQRPGPAFVVVPLGAWLGDPTSVALADLDGDGDLDVVSGVSCWGINCSPSNDAPANVVYLNDGTGNFGPAVVLTDTDNSHTWAAAVLDADGDGDRDLVFGNDDGNSPQNDLLTNDGTGTFTSVLGSPIGSAFPEDFDDTYAVLVGDLDLDGDDDLVCVNAPPSVPLGAPSPSSRVYVNLMRHLTAPDLARLGQPYRLRLDGAPGGAWLLLATGPSSSPTPWGRFGLDPASTLVAWTAPPPATGSRIEASFVVPPVRALAGLTLWWQGLVAGTQGPRLTNVVADRIGAY